MMSKGLGHVVIDNIKTMAYSHEHANIIITRLSPVVYYSIFNIYGVMVSDHGHIIFVLFMSRYMYSYYVKP